MFIGGWDKWEEIGKKDLTNPRRRFLKQILERSSWLVPREKLVNVLPMSWRNIPTLLPRIRKQNCRFFSKDGYALTSIENYELSKPLPEAAKYLLSNPSREQWGEWITIHTKAMLPNLKLEYILNSALVAGMRSFSDTTRAIYLVRETLIEAMLALGDEDTIASGLIDIVLAFWSNSWEWTSFVLLHFVHVGLLRPSLLAKYFCIFHAEQLNYWQVFVLLRRLIDFPCPFVSYDKSGKAINVGIFGGTINEDDKANQDEDACNQTDEMSQRELIIEIIKSSEAAIQSTEAQQRIAILLEWARAMNI